MTSWQQSERADIAERHEEIWVASLNVFPTKISNLMPQFQLSHLFELIFVRKHEAKPKRRSITANGLQFTKTNRHTHIHRESKCDQIKRIGLFEFMCRQTQLRCERLCCYRFLFLSSLLIFTWAHKRTYTYSVQKSTWFVTRFALRFNCWLATIRLSLFLPVSGMAPVRRFASSPRTLAITFCGEFEPPKRAPPNFENKAESPPLVLSEEATVSLFVERNQ